MKKLVFGCALMISGMIGSVGWLIAGASLVQNGAWSTLFNIFSKADGAVVIIFLLISIAGGIIAATSLKEKNSFK